MQFLSEQFDNRTKFLALFLMWTLCLGLTTLSIQHSCNPMLGVPSPECRIVVEPPPEPPPPIPPDPPPSPQECGKFIPSMLAGAGGGFAAGVGTSALAGAGVISATITVGGAIIAAPATVAVGTGILIFLAVQSLIGGAC